MTQDLFDIMAISQAMARLRKSQELDRMLASATNGYRRSYPDEDFALISIDLDAASREIESISTQIYETLFEQNRSDRDSIYFAVLKELSNIVTNESRKRRPFLKRVFGGTYFNYESELLANRVEKCRENVSLAGMMILAKQAGALDHAFDSLSARRAE
jgi:hypothetical protein